MNNNGKKSGLCEAMDALPFWVKLLLCIPFLDIVWAVYRIVKGIETSNNILLLVGILWIVPGGAACWAVDLITTLLNGRPILT